MRQAMLSENLPSLARLGLIQHLDDQGGFVDLREFRMGGNRRIIARHQSHKSNPIPADALSRASRVTRSAARVAGGPATCNTHNSQAAAARFCHPAPRPWAEFLFHFLDSDVAKMNLGPFRLEADW